MEFKIFSYYEYILVINFQYNLNFYIIKNIHVGEIMIGSCFKCITFRSNYDSKLSRYVHYFIGAIINWCFSRNNFNNFF